MNLEQTVALALVNNVRAFHGLEPISWAHLELTVEDREKALNQARAAILAIREFSREARLRSTNLT